MLADADGEPRPVLDREDATTALTTLAADPAPGACGCKMSGRDAVKVVARWGAQIPRPGVGSMAEHAPDRAGDAAGGGQPTSDRSLPRRVPPSPRPAGQALVLTLPRVPTRSLDAYRIDGDDVS